MAYLLPSRFSAVFYLGAALLVSGCCANNVCNCDDAQADAIGLRFVNFAASDLDTVSIVRYPLEFTRATIPERVTIIGTAPGDTITLNNTTPFAQVGTTKLNQYHYLVQYQVGSRLSRPVTALIIDKVALQGSFEGSGCCTCYTNTQKAVTIRKDSATTASTTDLKNNPVLTITK